MFKNIKEKINRIKNRKEIRKNQKEKRYKYDENLSIIEKELELKQQKKIREERELELEIEEKERILELEKQKILDDKKKVNNNSFDGMLSQEEINMLLGVEEEKEEVKILKPTHDSFEDLKESRKAYFTNYKDIINGNEFKIEKIKHPKNIKAILDEYIIGQENAKTVVSQTIFNHIQIVKYGLDVPEQNVLLVGPSGSGKTEMFRVLKGELGLNVHILDMTDLASAGFSSSGGIHLKDKLKNVKNGDIVILDEFDKVCMKGISSGGTDVGNVLQTEFLKLLEGERKDLEDCLFILTGAFTNLLNNKKGNNPIGFSNPEIKENKKNIKISVNDLVKEGMLTEIIGRITFIEQLNELTNEDYLNILKNSKSSIYKKYQEEYKDRYNLDITFEDDLLINLCQEMKDSKLGVRGLNAKIIRIFNNTLYKQDNIDNINTIKIVINKDSINKK